MQRDDIHGEESCSFASFPSSPPPSAEREPEEDAAAAAPAAPPPSSIHGPLPCRPPGRVAQGREANRPAAPRHSGLPHRRHRRAFRIRFLSEEGEAAMRPPPAGEEVVEGEGRRGGGVVEGSDEEE